MKQAQTHSSTTVKRAHGILVGASNENLGLRHREARAWHPLRSFQRAVRDRHILPNPAQPMNLPTGCLGCSPGCLWCSCIRFAAAGLLVVLPLAPCLQGFVEDTAASGAGERLHLPTDRIAAEQWIRHATQLACFDGIGAPLGTVENNNLCSRGDVEPGFDDGVIPNKDANSGVRAEQRALTNAHALSSAARQRAHDGCPPTDIRANTDDNSL